MRYVLSQLFLNKQEVEQQSMAFNPFSFFKGNPKVQELLSSNQPLHKLLIEDSFVSEFKKNDNEALQKYMNYQRYEELIGYITTIDTTHPHNNDRNYKFPFVAADILAVNNPHTLKHLLEETLFVEQEVQEEVEVEKQVNSESSDRSYSSIKSDRSSPQRDYQQDDKQNYVLRQQNDKHLSEMSFGDEISADDFPDVKAKRTVIVKEIIRKKVKRGYQPLICVLLEYFQQKQVIHILDGYVCRVLDNVLTNRFGQMLDVIKVYGCINAVKKMFTHIESQSVQDFLLCFVSRLTESGEKDLIGEEISFTEFIQKVCTTPFEKWSSNTQILQQKVYIVGLFALILGKLDEKLSGVGAEEEEQRIQQLRGSVEVVGRVVRGEFVKQQIATVSALIQVDKQHPIYAKLLLQYLLNLKTILKLYLKLKAISQDSLSNENIVTINKVLEQCEESFDNFIQIGFKYVAGEEQLTDSTIQTVRQHHAPLRCKIQVLQILGVLMKHNLYFARKSLISLPNIETIPQLFEAHPTSSIYHNGLLGLLLPFVECDHDSITLNSFFSKRHLLRQVYQLVKEDLEIRYSHSKKSRKCYVAHMHQLCVAINQLQDEESQQLIQFRESQEWQFIHEYLREEEKGMVLKSLGGHCKQKNKKSIISFTKEESLTLFKQFLQGDKFNNLEDFQNYEPGASDSQEDESYSPHVYESEGFEPGNDAKIPHPFDRVEDQAKYFSDESL